MLIVKISQYKQLNLVNNNIKIIEPDAFGNHHPLAIDLSGNELTFLNESVFLPLLSNSTLIDVSGKIYIIIKAI